MILKGKGKSRIDLGSEDGGEQNRIRFYSAKLKSPNYNLNVK